MRSAQRDAGRLVWNNLSSSLNSAARVIEMHYHVTPIKNLTICYSHEIGLINTVRLQYVLP